MPLAAYRLPSTIFRYVLAISWPHQVALVVLTVITFLLEVAPLEIQRRVVNNLVKDRPFLLVVTLCAAYAGAVLIQGATKLGLNVYRGWVAKMRRGICANVSSPIRGWLDPIRRDRRQAASETR